MISQRQIDLLNQPLSRGKVSNRKGSGGRTLSYVEWHECVRVANEIFGFGGWTAETLELSEIATYTYKDKSGAEKPKVTYRARVRVQIMATGATYDGWGYGEGIDPDLGQAHESAFKEAESDATKRALRNLGDQFGLALYDKAQAHVEDDSKPNASPDQDIRERIKEASQKLNLTQSEFAEHRKSMTEAGTWPNALFELAEKATK
jgi:DNA repair and recombination protein RAD52